MRTLMITVGISLLSNRGWKRGEPLPEPTQVAADLQNADLTKASAETATLAALPLRENDRLVWLQSETPEGRLCAEALAGLYQDQEHDCCLEVIQALNYHAASFGDRGLKSLLDVAFKVIREADQQQREVVICATGGFKAEIAFMNLIGLLMQIPVVACGPVSTCAETRNAVARFVSAYADTGRNATRRGNSFLAPRRQAVMFA